MTCVAYFDGDNTQFSILLRKLYKLDNKICIYVKDDDIQNILSEFLWKSRTFIPHGINSDTDSKFFHMQPIWITSNLNNINKANLIINYENVINCIGDTVLFWNVPNSDITQFNCTKWRYANEKWEKIY